MSTTFEPGSTRSIAPREVLTSFYPFVVRNAEPLRVIGSDLKIVIRYPCVAGRINSIADHAARTETSEQCHFFPQKTTLTKRAKVGMNAKRNADSVSPTK